MRVFHIPPVLKSLLEWTHPIVWFVTEPDPEKAKHHPKSADSTKAPPPGPTASPTNLGSWVSYGMYDSSTGRLMGGGSTRAPAIYDMHMTEDLVLQRTGVLSRLTDHFAIICDAAIASSGIVDIPPDHLYINDNGEHLDDLYKEAHVYRSELETALLMHHTNRETIAATIASSILADRPDSERWPLRPDRANSNSMYFQTSRPSQNRRAVADGFFYLDSQCVTGGSLDPHFKLARSENLSPYVVMEMKGAAGADLGTFMAIIEVCQSGDPFPWMFCSSSPRHRAAKKKCTPKCTPEGFQESGRATGLDSHCAKELILSVASDGTHRDLNTSNPPIPIVQGMKTRARHIIQQVRTYT